MGKTKWGEDSATAGGSRSARGQCCAKREGGIEDQKPCGRRDGHVSIFRGIGRILSTGQKQLIKVSPESANRRLAAPPALVFAL